MDNETFAKALAFAAIKHAEQTRREGTPYIYHPIRVAEILRDAGYGLEYQVVALLHDTLEDTDATEDDIRKYGDDVLEAVSLLTRPDGADEKKYVDAILKNPLAAAVKAADKMDNVRCAAETKDRKWGEKYIRKARVYYYGRFSDAFVKAICLAEEGIGGYVIWGTT